MKGAGRVIGSSDRDGISSGAASRYGLKKGLLSHGTGGGRSNEVIRGIAQFNSRLETDGW